MFEGKESTNQENGAGTDHPHIQCSIRRRISLFERWREWRIAVGIADRVAGMCFDAQMGGENRWKEEGKGVGLVDLYIQKWRLDLVMQGPT